MLDTVKYANLKFCLKVFDTIYENLLYKNNEAELCQKDKNISRILRLFQCLISEGSW